MPTDTDAQRTPSAPTNLQDGDHSSTLPSSRRRMTSQNEKLRKATDMLDGTKGKLMLQDTMNFTDMLDGTSLSTIGGAQTVAPSNNANSMSAQTDSIISLPPMDDRSSRWNNLRSAVPPRLRQSRGGSLGGRDISKIIDNRQRKPPPVPIPLTNHEHTTLTRKPKNDDVRIEFSPMTASSQTPLTQRNTSMGRLKRSSARMIPDDSPEEIDQIIPREDNVSFFNYGAMGGQGDSTNIDPYGPSRDDDELSTGNSSQGGSVSRRRRRRQNRASRRQEEVKHQWDWRFPGNEDALMPSMAWIYLPLIGWLIFLMAFLVNYGEYITRDYFIAPIHRRVIHFWGGSVGLVSLCLIRAAVVLTSFAIVRKYSPLYGPGSGIPEMKCVLTGVFMPNALSGRTLFSKMLGLSLVSASGISVGKMGPFMHMGGMVASLVSRIPIFKALNENPLFKLQALSASMAAGVGATLGAPLGGVLLSIELMSAYYYIHWLPMALICSIMGYYLLLLFVEKDTHVYFNPDIVISITGDSFWYLGVYCLLGVLCGFVGYCLIRFTILMKKTISWIFSDDQASKIAAFLVAFVFLHTVIAETVGGVLAMPQKSGVDSLFGSEKSNAYDWLNSSLQIRANSIGSAFSLFVIMWIKFALTGISLMLPIPAGTFMPIFEIGAFLGRSYGELLSSLKIFNWIDPRATAIVGAASLASGTLHITSIALVMLELTREAVNVLPMTISVVCSYAVSKSLSSDLFSELIKFRRLPYILGLREQYPQETKDFHETVSLILAKAFMRKKFPFITPNTTVSAARKLLGEPWQVVAFLNDEKEKRLYGVVKRRDLESVLSNNEGFISQAGSSTGDTLSSRDSSRKYIGFLRNFDPSEGHQYVDMGVMQVSMYTPFWKVITYFRMLSMNVMYVMTTTGTVAGVITKPLVIEHCIALETQARVSKGRERDNARQQRKGEMEAVAKYDGSLRVSRSIARRISSTNLAAMDSSSNRGMSRRMSSANLSGLDSGRRSRNGSMTLP